MLTEAVLWIFNNGLGRALVWLFRCGWHWLFCPFRYREETPTGRKCRLCGHTWMEGTGHSEIAW